MSSSESTIDVRAVQARPILGNIEHNLDLITKSLSKATTDDIDLVVYPELFLTGYHIGELDIGKLAKKIDDACSRIADCTADLTAVIGTPVFEDEQLFNSAVVFDSGSIVGTYHKTHLYGDEPSVFQAGSTFQSFETSAGNLGVQICYDLEFPEVSRQLSLRDAQVLVTLSANMRPFAHDQTVYSAARALENIRPHVVSNRIGEERGVEFFGGSRILDERGRPVVTAGKDVIAEISGSINLQAKGVDTLQYLQDRRPGIYDRRD